MNRQKLIILPKLCNCGGDNSKQWFVYYSCRDPRTGKMHRFRHYDGFTSLSEKEKLAHAQQLIEMYSTRLRSGWSPFTDDTQVVYNDHIDYQSVAQIYGTKRSGNRSVRLWISKFIDTITPGISHSTYLTYKSKLRIFVLWLEHKKISENDLSTFDSNLIGLFFHYLIDERKLSKVTIDSYAELLTVTFEYFKKEKLILINPVFDIPVCNRINDQAPRPIQRADIEVFKKELQKDPELWLAVMFEFYCSLRPGHEIREMKIKDIDFITGTVRVTRERAKSRIERIVTVPQQLMLQLRNFYKLQTYNRELYIFGRGGIPGPEHIGKNKLNYKFNKIRKKLKMPDEYKFYSWKHTGLIEADENNIPYKDISRHAGHSSPSITDDYFANKKVSTSKAIRDNYPTL
jgi:integrase